MALAPLKSIILPSLFTAGITLQHCHKLPDVFEQLSLYSIKLYICITISISSALSTIIYFAYAAIKWNTNFKFFFFD